MLCIAHQIQRRLQVDGVIEVAANTECQMDEVEDKEKNGSENGLAVGVVEIGGSINGWGGESELVRSTANIGE